MGDLLQPWHLILLAIVAFLLFGAKRLPELGKGLGEGLKGFREGIKGITDPGPQAPTQQSAANTAAAADGKATYRCPNCKNLVSASVPNPNAAEDKGFCPECGNQFDKKTARI